MLQITTSRIVDGFIWRLVILESHGTIGLLHVFIHRFTWWNSLVRGQCWVKSFLLVSANSILIIV